LRHSEGARRSEIQNADVSSQVGNDTNVLISYFH